MIYPAEARSNARYGCTKLKTAYRTVNILKISFSCLSIFVDSPDLLTSFPEDLRRELAPYRHNNPLKSAFRKTLGVFKHSAEEAMLKVHKLLSEQHTEKKLLGKSQLLVATSINQLSLVAGENMAMGRRLIMPASKDGVSHHPGYYMSSTRNQYRTMQELARILRRGGPQGNRVENTPGQDEKQRPMDAILSVDHGTLVSRYRSLELKYSMALERIATLEREIRIMKGSSCVQK